uniref:Lectin n=1 Tax=Luffa acutangula TaxID=56866 RepID=LEC_LUFAC|nr:RecName: Full=Lectin; AltName: Full=Agglutinin; Short=LAA [Luffa acutangula]
GELVGGEVKVGHNLEAILKGLDVDVYSVPSFIKLYDQVTAGIFLNNRTKRYWFDKNAESNCFMLYARDLLITWSQDKRYWRWNPFQEHGNTLEVAELIDVCWLNIVGNIETSVLSPGISYEAAFEVMLTNSASGWRIPVDVKLKMPDGSEQESQVNLQDKPRGVWFFISVGHFKISVGETIGNIEFSIVQHQEAKRGLLVKGLVIQPKQ